MDAKDRDLIKGLEHRSQRMRQDYEYWEPHYRELRDHIEPALGRFELGERREGSTINKKILDSTPRKAMRTLTSGLMAGMTSPSRPWFKLGAAGDEISENAEAKEWLHLAQTRMYTVLRGSNAYEMLANCYRNLALYGTFGGMVVGDFDDVIHCHSFQMGRFTLGLGAKDRHEHLHREIQMTIGQVVERFGLDNVSDRLKTRFKGNNIHDPIVVCHAVERRRDRDPLSMLSKDKPWASIYWEKDGQNILEQGGFSVNPLMTPRWESVEGEAWGVSSPAMVALGDVRQLQVQQRDKAIAIQKMYNPPLQGNNQIKGAHFRNIPGGVSTVDANDLRTGGLRPIYDVKPDVAALSADIMETQRRVNEAFFVDLFLMTALSDRRQVTAREIAERHEEKLLVLGPVLESLDHGLLQPLIQATFYHMQEAEILPPAPDVLVDTPIKVEYISALAQAQKAVGVAPIERTIGFVATMEQIKPGSVDWIDEAATIKDFTDQIGPPPGMLHTPQEVEKTRQARAEQAQQDQLVENAQPLASAASLISEASERGVDGIQRGAPL